jgi:hypothetical protein
MKKVKKVKSEKPDIALGMVRKLLMEDGFDASLEGFLANVQRNTRDAFLRKGELSTAFFLLSEVNGKCMVTQVESQWNSEEENAITLAAVKSFANEKDANGVPLVKSYVLVAEAVKPSKDPEDPDNLEVVTVLGKERGRPGALGAMAEVQRHALSSKPNLKEWEAIDRTIPLPMLGVFEDDDARQTVH